MPNDFTGVCLSIGDWLPSMHHKSHDQHRGGRLASQHASQVKWPRGSASGGSTSSGETICIQGEEGLHPGGDGSASRGRSLHPGEGVGIKRRGESAPTGRGSAYKGIGRPLQTRTRKVGSTHPSRMLPYSHLFSPTQPNYLGILQVYT